MIEGHLLFMITYWKNNILHQNILMVILQGYQALKKKSHCNEFAPYYEKREIFSLSDSSSNGHLDDDVRPVAVVLVHVPENHDVEYLAKVNDDDNRNINGRNGR